MCVSLCLSVRELDGLGPGQAKAVGGWVLPLACALGQLAGRPAVWHRTVADDGRRVPSFLPSSDHGTRDTHLQVLEEGTYFEEYALAIYTWMMYMVARTPCVALPALAARRAFHMPPGRRSHAHGGACAAMVFVWVG